MAVYLIASESGPVKIGWAHDPEARLRELQTASHETLSLVTTIPGGQREERDFHKRFSHLRLRGEWFQPDDEIYGAFYHADPYTKGWTDGMEGGRAATLEWVANRAKLYAYGFGEGDTRRAFVAFADELREHAARSPAERRSMSRAKAAA